MWQQEDNNSDYEWEDAISYCEGLSLAGYTDWRLSNIRELASIVDTDKTTQPPIDETYFPNTNPMYYWSSTTRANDTLRAWSVSFGYGYATRDNTKFD